MKNVLRVFAVCGAILSLAACAPSSPQSATPASAPEPAVASVALIPIDKIPRDARGRIKRSAAVIAAFQRRVPCPNLEARADPATAGGTKGSCPGFEIDHIIALCRGGPDTIENLQWLWDVEHDEIKTPKDVALCRALRKRR